MIVRLSINGSHHAVTVDGGAGSRPNPQSSEPAASTNSGGPPRQMRPAAPEVVRISAPARSWPRHWLTVSLPDSVDSRMLTDAAWDNH